MGILKLRLKKKRLGPGAPGLVEPVDVLLESAGIMVFALDLKANIKYLNKQAAKVTGYSQEEVLGKSIIELLVPEDMLKDAERGFDDVRAGMFLSETRPIICRDGNSLEVSLNVNPIRDDNGSVEGVLVFMQDLTEAIQRETELARKSALAQGILDEATVPIIILSPEGRILYFNTTFEDICGYQLEEVADSDWFEAMIPEPWRLPLREFHATMKERRASGVSFVAGRPLENPIMTKAGAIINISWKNNILFDQEGKVEATISFAELLD